jgi:hypothetical protein
MLLPNPQASYRGIWVLEIQMNRDTGGLGLIKPYDGPVVNCRASTNILLQLYLSLSFPPLTRSLPCSVFHHQGFCPPLLKRQS